MTAPTPQERLWAELGDGSVLPELMRADIEASLTALAAATADRDDARRELAEQKRINTSNLRVMTEQLELARQTIADAPHAHLCKAANGWPNNDCDCWKVGL